MVDKSIAWNLAKLADEAEQINNSAAIPKRKGVGRYGKLLRCTKKRRRCN
jgi:hypothetical protein